MTAPEPRHRNRNPDINELIMLSSLLILGVIGYFVVPAGAGRAVLVLPALVWIPGRCLVVCLGLHRSAGFWSAPLSVLLSFAAMIAAALVQYAAFRRVEFGPLPLWVSLAALQLIAWRPRRPAPSSRQWARAGPWRTAGLFFAGTAASAAVLAGVYHVLPAQQQAGYLQFAYAGHYAALPGVVSASAGQQLAIPFNVTASDESTSGLSVVAHLDGHQVGPAVPVALAPNAAAPGVTGDAVMDLDVAAGCLSRYTFTLEQHSTAVRTLDLYVTTAGGSAAASTTCRGG